MGHGLRRRRHLLLRLPRLPAAGGGAHRRRGLLQLHQHVPHARQVAGLQVVAVVVAAPGLQRDAGQGQQRQQAHRQQHVEEAEVPRRRAQRLPARGAHRRSLHRQVTDGQPQRAASPHRQRPALALLLRLPGRHQVGQGARLSSPPFERARHAGAERQPRAIALPREGQPPAAGRHVIAAGPHGEVLPRPRPHHVAGHAHVSPAHPHRERVGPA